MVTWKLSALSAERQGFGESPKGDADGQRKLRLERNVEDCGCSLQHRGFLKLVSYVSAVYSNVSTETFDTAM